MQRSIYPLGYPDWNNLNHSSHAQNKPCYKILKRNFWLSALSLTLTDSNVSIAYHKFSPKCTK